MKTPNRHTDCNSENQKTAAHRAVSAGNHFSFYQYVHIYIIQITRRPVTHAVETTQNKPANKHTDAVFNLFSLQSLTHLNRLHNSVSTAQTSGENLCTNLATFLTFFLHMGKTKEAGNKFKIRKNISSFPGCVPSCISTA